MLCEGDILTHMAAVLMQRVSGDSFTGSDAGKEKECLKSFKLKLLSTLGLTHLPEKIDVEK